MNYPKHWAHLERTPSGLPVMAHAPRDEDSGEAVLTSVDPVRLTILAAADRCTCCGARTPERSVGIMYEDHFEDELPPRVVDEVAKLTPGEVGLLQLGENKVYFRTPEGFGHASCLVAAATACPMLSSSDQQRPRWLVFASSTVTRTPGGGQLGGVWVTGSEVMVMRLPLDAMWREKRDEMIATLGETVEVDDFARGFARWTAKESVDAIEAAGSFGDLVDVAKRDYR